VADGGDGIEISQNLLADKNRATHGVVQEDGDKCDREEPKGMSQRKKNDARNKKERSPPSGGTRPARHLVQWLALHLVQRLVCHLVQRLARHLTRRPALLRHILVSGRGWGVKFEGFGNLTKALTFSAERAACVAECRVAEHARLIHALDVGQNSRPQQQSTLFDQVGHFREAQLGTAEGLRGPVLGGLGHDRILRVHLLHLLFQECHVIDHRKTAPAIASAMAQLCRRRALA
jgi:hypothetical protein